MKSLSTILLVAFTMGCITVPMSAYGARECFGEYEVSYRTSESDRQQFSVYSRHGRYTDNGDCQALEQVMQAVDSRQQQGYEVRVVKTVFDSHEVVMYAPR